MTVPLPPAEAVSIPATEDAEVDAVAGSTTRETTFADRSLNILLADDAEENRMVVQAYLSTTSHQVTVAENGIEAVERFKNGDFDLVLMDIQMPEMDGYEATRRIRAWEAETGAAPTPIIALTAHVMAEAVERIKEAGCDMHLGKPVRKKRLLETIAQVSGQDMA